MPDDPWDTPALPEAAFSVTFTPGKPPLITVRGATADEYRANIEAMNEVTPGGTLGDLIRNTNDLIQGMQAIQDGMGGRTTTVSHQNNSQQRGNGNWQGGRGGQSNEPPFNGGSQGSLTPDCLSCGAPTQYKEGQGKRGPYKGYFCTAPNSRCTPQWVK